MTNQEFSAPYKDLLIAVTARSFSTVPFAIQICLNGREWLARAKDAAGLHYVQRDNCFSWLEDPERAQ